MNDDRRTPDRHDADTTGHENDRIRSALDAEARSIENRHGDRLAAARRAALASAPDGSARGSSRRPSRWPIGLAAGVAVAVLASLVLQQGPAGRSTTTPATTAGLELPSTVDLELLASDEYELLVAEDYGLLDEDLEFYAWLAVQDPAVQVPSEERSG